METQPQPKRVDPPPDKLIATMTRPPISLPTVKEKQGCGCFGFLLFCIFVGLILWFTWNQL
jgi:hypothetical protein